MLGLDEVVDSCSPLVMSILHAEMHESSSVKIAEVLSEAMFEIGKTDWLEAWEARVPHDFDEILDL